MTEHVHVFNAISGYCACGVQFCPHLVRVCCGGGGTVGGPPRWPDDALRFVTRLGPGDTVAPVSVRVE